MMSSEKEILKKLVVPKEAVQESLERIVSKLQHFVKIEEHTGKIFLENVDNLPIADKIILLLSARYFACRLGYVDSEFLRLKDIATELAVPMTSLSGPLKRLKDDGVVQKREIGEYAIVYYRIERAIDEILSKVKKEGRKEIE
jgi:DNA-binding transcriptional ArsR family regulator